MKAHAAGFEESVGPSSPISALHARAGELGAISEVGCLTILTESLDQSISSEGVVVRRRLVRHSVES